MPSRNAPLAETGRLRLARCVVEDRVAAGVRVIDPKLALAALEMKENPLSEREADVLRRFAAGVDLPEIARSSSCPTGPCGTTWHQRLPSSAVATGWNAVRVATKAGWL